ncbi:MAG TPA: cell division protein ZapA [Bacteroidales bacterium]|nr:cell division protein ZapA [Bacteroidales bacterium]
MKEQLISVIIAERPYRLSIVNEEEEQTFREAGRLIRDRMAEFGNTYAFRDKQDLLAMVALQCAVDYLNLNNKIESHSSLKDKLFLIEKILDESLKES